MKATVTNLSGAVQGVWSDDGLVFIDPGQSRLVAIASGYAERARSLPFLKVEPVEEPKRETPAKVDPLDHDGDGTRGGSLKGAQSTRSKGSRAKTE